MLSNCGAGEDSWESLGLQDQTTQPKGNQLWIFTEGLMLKLKLQSFGHLMQRADSLEKTLMLGKNEGRRRRRGWERMRWLDAIIDWMDMSLSKLGDTEGQGGLACCSPRGRKESDTTERPNSDTFFFILFSIIAWNGNPLQYSYLENLMDRGA